MDLKGIEGAPNRLWGDPANPVTLGPDEYFLLGDNTSVSSDSRSQGPAKRADLIGVVDVIYWPFERMRILP